MSSVPVVEVRDVHREFEDVKAVTGISFSIDAGQVVGFVGENGAGKTTTMRMIATLDLPTSGSIHVCGKDTVHNQIAAREYIGWMPDAFGHYEYMTVHEYLDFFARLFRFRGRERERRVHEILDFVELSKISKQYMDTLSKGMLQRLCLGRALLNDPKILIMDEPAAGLDPKARVEFKRLVRILAKEGKTLFISSHILTELEDMSDSLIFIHRGKIIHQGSAEDLKARGTAKGIDVEIRVSGDLKNLEEWIVLNPGARLVEVTEKACIVKLDSAEKADVADYLQRLIAAGIKVVDFHRRERRLEDAFIDLLGSNVEAKASEKEGA